MLKFLGTGAAFNYNLNNNSAYFIQNKKLYLFDCGEKICDCILKHKILDEVDEVYCFITHLHSDHVASLEPLMFYLHYVSPKKLYIFYPNPIKLKKLLILMGIDFDFEIFSDFSILKDIKVDFVKQKHMPSSFGYFVYTSDKNFFYSGDTSIVNKRAVDELKNSKLDLIYHEVTISPTAKIHTHISKLEKAIPKKLREKVFLMHLSSDEVTQIAKEKGFCVCTEI